MKKLSAYHQRMEYSEGALERKAGKFLSIHYSDIRSAVKLPLCTVEGGLIGRKSYVLLRDRCFRRLPIGR